MANPITAIASIGGSYLSNQSNNRAARHQQSANQAAIDAERAAASEARDAQQQAADRAIGIFEQLTPEVRQILSDASAQAAAGQQDAANQSIALLEQTNPEIRELLNLATNQAVGGQSAAAGASLQGFNTATDQSINELRGQYGGAENLFAPYINAGSNALGGQLDLAGLNGPEAQSTAIAALEGSPEFQARIQQGENALLQNASATGGLRGGNTQAALAQFRPRVLSDLINNQYSRLGGLAGSGLNTAGAQANLGQALGSNIASLLGGNASNRANILTGAAGSIGNLLTGNATNQGNLLAGQAADIGSLLRGNAANQANLATGTAGNIGNLLSGTATNIGNVLTGNASNQANLLTNSAANLGGFYQNQGNIAANRLSNQSGIQSNLIDQFARFAGAGGF